MHIKNLLSEVSHKVFEYYFPKALDGKLDTIQNLEVRLKRKDGSIIPAEAHVTISRTIMEHFFPPVQIS